MNVAKHYTLVHPLQVAVVLLVVAVVLYVLFPQQSVFRNPLYIEAPDELSIAYLEVLQRSNPNNDDIRYNLARQYRLTGQGCKALETLQPFKADAAKFAQQHIYTEYVEYLIAGGCTNSGQDTQAILLEIDDRLRAVLPLDWPLEDKNNFLAEKFSLAGLSTREQIYRWRIETFGGSAGLYEDLASVCVAGGKLDCAASAMESAIDVAPPDDKLSLARKLLSIKLQTGNPSAALLSAENLISQQEVDALFLDYARMIAVQAGRQDLATSWLEKGVELNPEDVAKLEELLTVYIATGEYSKAVSLAEKRLALPAVPAELRLKIARLYNWVQMPEQSLQQLTVLLKEHGLDEVIAKDAWHLARELFRYENALAVLDTVAAQRVLTKEEIKQKLQLNIEIGNIEAGKHLLSQAIAMYPSEREYYTLLADLYAESLNLNESIKIYEVLATKFGLTLKERLTLSRHYQQVQKPRKALKTLLSGTGRLNRERKEFAQNYLMQISELAIALNETEIASAIWGQLVESDMQRVDFERSGHFEIEEEEEEEVLSSSAPVAKKRKRDTSRQQNLLQNLITLHVSEKSYAKAMQLSENGFYLYGEKRFLLQALSISLHLPTDLETRRLLAVAEEQTSKFVDSAEYWGVKAVLAEVDGDVLPAMHAYSRAREIQPFNQSYRNAWLWLMISHIELFEEELSYALKQYEHSVKDRELISILAYGWSSLGEYQSSLGWFVKYSDTKKEDLSWQFAMASNLEQMGFERAAIEQKGTILNALQMKLAANKQLSFDEQQIHLSLVKEFAGYSEAEKLLETYLESAEKERHKSMLLTKFAVAWAEARGDVELASYYQAMAHHYSDKKNKRYQENPVMQQRQAEVGTQPEKISHSRGVKLAALERKAAVNNDYYDPNLLATEFHLYDFGSFSLAKSRLSYTHSNERNRWMFSLENYSFENDDASERLDFIDEVLDQKEAILKVTQIFGDNEFAVGFRAVDRNEETKLGGTVSFQNRLGVSLTQTLAIDRLQRDAISSTLYALADKNSIEYKLDWQLDHRLRVEGSVGSLEYVSFDDVDLSSGRYFRIGGEYIAMAAEPKLVLRTGYYDFTSSDNENLLNGLTPYYASAMPVVTDILPEAYRRLEFGIALGHGEVHGKLRLPAPRWHIAFDIGYEFERQSFDTVIRGGLGWRIFGRDEFAVSVLMASDSLTGDETASLQASYRVRF